MRRELLEEIPDLQLLLAELKKANLADTVWMCVGGNPADYKRLLGFATYYLNLFRLRKQTRRGERQQQTVWQESNHRFRECGFLEGE